MVKGKFGKTSKSQNIMKLVVARKKEGLKIKIEAYNGIYKHDYLFREHRQKTFVTLSGLLVLSSYLCQYHRYNIFKTI